VATNIEIDQRLHQYKGTVVTIGLQLLQIIPTPKRYIVASGIQNLINGLEFLQKEQKQHCQLLPKEPLDLSLEQSQLEIPTILANFPDMRIKYAQ
jgi:hypothetical protein